MPSRRTAPPPRQVEAMFDKIVRRYDLVNGLLSLGLDRRWRRAAARSVGASRGRRVLDLGCGTGDLALEVARSGGPVIGVDLSQGMLAEAHRKAHGRVFLVRGSAFALPFAEGAFMGVVSGFVLRNLDDLPGAFAELARVVEPSGTVALVDITEPASRTLRKMFDMYFGTMAPALGSLVGQRDAYRYLARSLGQLPPPAEVCRLLEEAGFETASARPLTAGMVTLFTATRSSKRTTES